MSLLRKLSQASVLFMGLLTCASACSPVGTSLRCAPGQGILDGTCVTQQVADFVVCIRSRGTVDLAGDRGQRISAEAKSAGMGAGTAMEARESLAAKYRTEAGADGERQVIDRCSNLINRSGAVGGGAEPPPPPTSAARTPPPRARPGTGGSPSGATPTPGAGSPQLGVRVSRGPDWKWEDQGKGMSGTVIGTGGKPGWVMVRWDTGEENDYRYGFEGAYDVAVLPGLVPQACDGGEDYGTVQVGSFVIPTKHRSVGGDSNWSDDMNQYVGKRARVTKFSGVDGKKCAVVRIDIDNGQFAWRVRDIGMP